MNFYTAIQDIKQTSSVLKKKKYLRKYFTSSAGRWVLYQAYDPRIIFGVGSTTIKKLEESLSHVHTALEDEDINYHIVDILKDFSQNRPVSYSLLYKRLKMADYRVRSVEYKVLCKHLECGISSKIINSVFPNLLPEELCQLVCNWDGKYCKYPCFVSPKIDGIRAELINGSFFSRKGAPLHGLKHIVKELSVLYPTFTRQHLTGELFIPGMTNDFDTMSGIIRAKKHPKKKLIHYAIFDNASMAALPLVIRYDNLTKFFPIWRDAISDKRIFLVPHYQVSSLAEIQELTNQFIYKGYEGAVVKQLLSFYEFKRSHNWMRRVPLITIEKRITGVYEGTRQFKGMLGGVYVEDDLKVGSGFSVKQRKDWWNNPKLIIGKMITIKAKGVNRHGRLRQPVFKGIRWDIKGV